MTSDKNDLKVIKNEASEITGIQHYDFTPPTMYQDPRGFWFNSKNYPANQKIQDHRQRKR
jgi:hypothetical protein